MRKRMERFGKLAILLIGLIHAASCTDRTGSGVFYPADEQTKIQVQTQDAVRSVDTSETTGEPLILVYVCGEVNCPGVYELKADSRVCDAIEAAGGANASAQLNALNLADWVSDGQKLYVPSETESVPVSVIQSEEADRKISINTATKDELMQLPGIGEAKAEAILEYRETCGGFRTAEDIMLVPGIKEAAYNKIKDRITADR